MKEKKKSTPKTQSNLLQRSLDIYFSPSSQSDNKQNSQFTLESTLESTSDRLDDRWPNRFEPFPDESLSSWMVRIAIANLTDLPSLITSLGENPHNFDYDIVLKGNLIQTLVQKTGITSEKIKSISLYYEKKSYDQFFADNPYHIQAYRKIGFTSWGGRGKNLLRYCPICLKSDKIPYFRKSWRFNFITICPIHNCFLETQCPHCHSPIVYHKVDWDTSISLCYKCKRNLSESIPRLISNSDPFLTPIKNLILSRQDFSTSNFYCLNFSWVLASFTNLSEPLYQNHNFTKQTEIIELWKNSNNGISKLSIFSDIFSLYLLVGVSIEYISKQSIMNYFFRRFYKVDRSFYHFNHFPCPVIGCDYRTDIFWELIIHLKTHPDDSKVEIKPDNAPERTEPVEIEFNDEDESNLPFKCELCERRFESKTRLNTHQREHSKPKQFVCTLCKCVLKKKSEYTDHITKHGEDWPYRCKHGHNLPNKRALQVHNQWYHIDDPD